MTDKNSVGLILKETRLSKDLSIEVVLNDLKISREIIMNLENGVIPDYISSVYVTGHLRTYANYLNLDSDQLVKFFKEEISPNQNDTLKKFPKPIVKRNFKILGRSTYLASFGLIVVSLYVIFIQSNDFQPNYSITPDLNEEMVSEIESIELETYSNDGLNESVNNQFVEKKDYNIEYKDLVKFNPSSAIATIPEKQDIINLKNNVTLKFLDSTWLQIRNSSNDIILSKLMDYKDEYTYSINDNFFITTGNAGNILIYLGGESKGKLGKKGEVVESINLSSKFN